MIALIILPALEKLINAALQSDSDALAKIAILQNQVIEINCTDWKIRFFIVCTNSELQFEKKYSGAAHTIITGTLTNFLQIFMKGADTKSIFEHPIEITGNTHNMTVLRDTFKNIDLDLEEKLSHMVGDVLAHKICFHVKETKKTLRNTAKKVGLQAEEYIYFEGKNLPTRKQVEKLYEDIGTLRNDVERAEQRIALLL